MRAGRFREDLLYRLDVFGIRLPPLREHIADLDDIAEALLNRLCEKYGRSKLALRERDLQSLKGHAFPGNVRELRNLLERSLLRTDSLAHELAMDLEWLKDRGNAHDTITSDAEAPVLPVVANRSLSPLERQEYELIAKTLAAEHGGIRRAAAKLGLTHQALLRRLQKWPELRQGSNSSE